MTSNYIIIFLGFIVSFILYNKFPKLKNDQNEDDIKVSVIIPMRNEEHNVETILNDLDNQNFKFHEIICVDDNSSDSTASIIKQNKVKYLLIDSLKNGWKGKTWACQRGAEEASGDVLLFLDADVKLSKNAIPSLLARYSKVNRPVSILPYHNVKKRHEFFSLFFNLLEVCVTYLSIFKKTEYVGFYGPVLLVDRQLFLEHGGYEKVKNDVVEDYFLGKYYKSKGINVDLLLGSDQIQFRMYPKGLSQLVEGWAKNFSKAALSTSLSLVAMIILWIGYLVSIFFHLCRGIYLNNMILVGIFGLVYLLAVAKLYVDLKNIGSFPLIVCVLYPIYLLAFILIFLYSIFSTFIFKTTTWKGRRL